MHEDLGKSIKVKFENIFLDPNNPRIAPEDSPGYEELKAIFSPDEQKRLSDRVWEVYSGGTLEHAILT